MRKIFAANKKGTAVVSLTHEMKRSGYQIGKKILWKKTDEGWILVLADDLLGG